MTPALLSFLADSLNESWNGFWDLITKANRLIDTDKAKEALQKPSLILRPESFYLLHRLNFCANDCSGYF